MMPNTQLLKAYVLDGAIEASVIMTAFLGVLAWAVLA